MGNDGGSIPRRHELVKNAARTPTVSELKATILESLGHAWENCAISGTRLEKDNVVSDWHGRLYNYEAILQGLMPTDEPVEITPASLGIRSLRDVAKLKISGDQGKWMCPISMKELGPSVKSVYLVPCGHVFAEVAVKEIKEKNCPECAEAFESSNVIAILPREETEIEKLRTRLADLKSKGLTHTLKKDKSDKKKKRKAGESQTAKEDEDITTKKPEAGSKKEREVDHKLNGINNPMAAALTARVMAEQDERNKRRKIVEEIRAR